MNRISDMMRRLWAALLALCLVLALTLPVFAEGEGTDTAEEKETYHIGTVEELLQLADYCRLDSWSENRTVVLDTDLELTGRDADLRAVTDDGRVLGSHVQQLLQRLGGLALGAHLEPAAEEQEGDDHGDGLEVNMVHAVVAGQQLHLHGHAGYPGVADEQRPDRPQVGGGGAE